MEPIKSQHLSRRIDSLDLRIHRFDQILQKVQNHRLLTGLSLCAFWVWAAVSPEVVLLNFIAFALLPLALWFFIKKSRNVKKHLLDLGELKLFYTRQRDRIKGVYTSEPPKSPLPDSPLINDLDLISNKSLLSQIDETFTSQGQSHLIELMLENCTNREKILNRQKRTLCLAKNSFLLTRLLLIGRQSPHLQSSKEHLLDFVSRPFTEKSFHRDLVILSGLFVLSLLGLVQHFYLKLFSPALFPLIHFAYFLYASSQLKMSLSRANDISLYLSHLLPVFQKLEAPHFLKTFSEYLPKTQRLSPSKKIKSINFILAALSIQAHPLVYILLNGVIPWSFFFTWLLDRKRKEIQFVLKDSLEELAEFEAFSSLALVYKYQSQSMPQVVEEPRLEFKNLFHPLIPRDSVVKNDFALASSTHLNLITGSNMAGKSTFLRTVGVNHILMQMGAPVFANHYLTSPFYLTSSIRVSDSLESGFSYFYAEVLRLKTIIEQSQSPPEILYLIDEIFRGTNNQERYIGSKAIIEALARSNGRGFVSTHDLELTQLESNRVKNFHFRDHVKKGKLVFPYKIQDGPCPTTNALKIMKDAGLPV